MTFFIIAFIAGALTVLAPCILPLLPVIIGSSVTARSKATPYVVVGSLALSIIAFTYLLKASTAFVSIPPEVWTYISGGILLIFGITLVFPGLWEAIPGMAKLSASSNKLVGTGYQKKNIWGDVLVGAALGPVFSTCSPTYFVILASVLPVSFALGTLYLVAYVLGLIAVLLPLALLGERFSAKLERFADPKSWFKRSIGVLFVIIGLLILTGVEKKLETAIIGSGFFDVTQIEQNLLAGQNGSGELVPHALTPEEAAAEAGMPAPAAGALTLVQKAAKFPKAPELVAPDAYLNTGGSPITISEFKGKKVVLIDFWTYSCINCKRTTPYLNAWYDKYEKDGLVIIGVHTPEFAFEHLPENVQKAIEDEGITYPVVLDNEYATWNAFKNQYWPRKYLIDIDGYVVYDHAGEGDYVETEAAIQAALAERAARLGTDAPATGSVSVAAETGKANSPETYFGWTRNEYLANGKKYTQGPQTFVAAGPYISNSLYLDGTWNIVGEYAKAQDDARVIYTYTAGRVYVVAGASGGMMTVLRDGKPLPKELRGADVDENSQVRIDGARLYDLIKEEATGTHTLELQVDDGIQVFTFTFG